MKKLRLGRVPAVSALLPIAAVAAVAMFPLSTLNTPAAGGLHVQKLPLAAYVGPIGAAPAGDPVDRLIGFNDVHGYIQAGMAGNLYGTASGGARQFAAKLETLRNAAPLTNGKPNVAVVGAGDQVGASPLASALFDDEPTLDVLKSVGLDFTSVGNHEFDKGPTALVRQQDGGCNSDGRSCIFHYNDSQTNTDPNVTPNATLGDSQAVNSYAGLGRVDPSDTTSQPYDVANVSSGYLAANVVVHSTGKPLFPAWGIKTFPNGTKVGFIGEVLASTPTIVTPSGVAGLDFLDEATTANSYVSAIKAAGASTIVLLIHQGGSQSATQGVTDTVDSCDNLTGDITPIINNLDPAIGVVISGHTHQAYDCSVTNSKTGKQVLVTSAAKYTQALTSVDLTLNPDGTLYSANAANSQIGTAANTNPNDPASTPVGDACPASASATPLARTGDDLYDHVRSIECAAELEAAPLANKVIGAISASITRNASNSGVETPLGDLIADSQLADEQGKTNDPNSSSTVIAFMNPGGVRNDLPFTPASSTGAQPGQVTYGEAFSVQPFGNSLTTETLTTPLIYQALEQQFIACKTGPGSGQVSFDKLLPVSKGFTYTVDLNRAACDQVVPGSAKLNGVPLDPNGSYRIEINNFLAAGGDNFTTFKSGTNQVGGDQDIDAFAGYLVANSDAKNYPPTSSVAPPAANRVTVVPKAAPAALPEGRIAVALPIIGLLMMAGFGWRRSRRNRSAGLGLGLG